MKQRNFITIADQIIKIILEECTFSKEKISNIIEQIEMVKQNNSYKAPEVQYISYEELSAILTANFIPSNSKWETKLMIIFNDLKGTIEEYWDDDNNELRRCE